MSDTVSVVATDNVKTVAGGKCSVCFEVFKVLYRCEHCGQCACESCFTMVVDDTLSWTGCDSCEPPKRSEEDVPVCPGCSEANGTDGGAAVRHDPPLCRTTAERKEE